MMKFFIVFAIISFLLMVGNKDPLDKKLFFATFVITILPILCGRW